MYIPGGGGTEPVAAAYCVVRKAADGKTLYTINSTSILRVELEIKTLMVKAEKTMCATVEALFLLMKH